MTSGPRRWSEAQSYTLQVVAPPPTIIYRVAGTLRPLAGSPINPFNPAPWGSLFNGRFDDPRIEHGKDTGVCFRVVYCASQLVGAFGETIQDFVPGKDEAAKLFRDKPPLDPNLLRNKLTKDWAHNRWIGATILDPTLRFLDIIAPQSRNALAIQDEIHPHLRSLADALGIKDDDPKKDRLDISAITGYSPLHRNLTKHIALYAHSLTDNEGNPVFAGVRYVSHANTAWECWTVFYDRLSYSPPVVRTFSNRTPELIEAADYLGVFVEP